MSAGLNVSPAQVSRSYHDLSYSKTFSCDVGFIYPVMCDECVPGDVFSIGAEFVVRANPLMAPLLHRIDVKADYFFVPYRILMGREVNHPEEGEWEDFITGGKDGKSAVVLPRWPLGALRRLNNLWDHLGFPIGTDNDVDFTPYLMPLDFPRRAYYNIFNEYYRDQDLVDELDITSSSNWAIRSSAWEKDYFTSARPWQQKGDPMAFPVNLAGSVNFTYPNPAQYIPLLADVGTNGLRVRTADEILSLGNQYGIESSTGNALSGNPNLGIRSDNNILTGILDSNQMNFSNTSTFDVADLRFIVQAQRWMERNARAGNRYTEFLKAHFGVYPNDARLQRPEYIGGIRSPIIISEVLQTSESTTNSPQGNLSGHGVTFDSEHVGKYRVEEFGLIMGLFRLMPKPMYTQGINRQWLRTNRFDFYMPEFAHLSEQEIISEELYSDGTVADTSIFGFQGRYNEMRFKQNYVAGLMRNDLKFWHMGRIFANRPQLNSEFISVDGDNEQGFYSVFRKDVFQVPSEPGFIVSFGNRLDVMRPLPVDPEPGMMDHI